MRKTIYTAVVGGYDKIEQPAVVAPGFDYILFTNDTQEARIGLWQVRPIPYHNKENTRIARWVKTHPHELLPDYDYSLWMDSNVVVDDPAFWEIVNGKIASGCLLASFDHNARSCIYEEALAVCSFRIDSLKNILPEMRHLHAEGYPRNNGLCETNVVLRCHHNPLIVAMDTDWWQMIDSYSKRDQLSFNYVVWKHNVPLELFFGPNSNSRNSPLLHCVQHNRHYTNGYYVWLSKSRPRYLHYMPRLYYAYIDAGDNIRRRAIFKLWLKVVGALIQAQWWWFMLLNRSKHYTLSILRATKLLGLAKRCLRR